MKKFFINALYVLVLVIVFCIAVIFYAIAQNMH